MALTSPSFSKSSAVQSILTPFQVGSAGVLASVCITLHKYGTIMGWQYVFCEGLYSSSMFQNIGCSTETTKQNRMPGDRYNVIATFGLAHLLGVEA